MNAAKDSAPKADKITCPKCKAQVKSNAKFCPECGNKLKDVYCRACGAKAAQGAKFCSECGEKLK